MLPSRLITFSTEEYDGRVSLLLIDASHDLASVRSDFRAWFPKLVPGGVVLFHDYLSRDWPDIKEAVAEFSPLFSSFCHYQTLAVATKS